MIFIHTAIKNDSQSISTHKQKNKYFVIKESLICRTTWKLDIKGSSTVPRPLSNCTYSKKQNASCRPTMSFWTAIRSWESAPTKLKEKNRFDIWRKLFQIFLQTLTSLDVLCPARGTLLVSTLTLFITTQSYLIHWPIWRKKMAIS